MNEKNKCILIIDDSTTNVVLLEAILNNKGYDIEKALSVKDAYIIMNKRLPDLILLDLLMPKINGFDFLQEVKANKQYKIVPIIVISAVTEKVNIQKAIDLGAIDFLKKPIDIPNLLVLVEKALKM